MKSPNWDFKKKSAYPKKVMQKYRRNGVHIPSKQNPFSKEILELREGPCIPPNQFQVILLPHFSTNPNFNKV